MLFPTVTFALFFVAVFVVHWAIRRYVLPWKVFLLGASWLFYGWWDARFVGLLAFSCVANYAFGLLIARASPGGGVWNGRSRTLVGLAVAVNLGVLGWFKYYGFFATSLTNTLNDIGLGVSPPLLDIVLPVGISFFTFQAISYVVDVGRGSIRPLNPLDFAVYLSFFPQLVAGPIVRATEFAPQLIAPPTIERIQTGLAFRLILIGLFKKVVISSYLATEIVDPVFALPEEHSSAEILFAVYGYAIQIYSDFSGYSDIAIGCALLLGFQLPQNFNSPYRALSMQDFWRRWHMSLSRWLRDYLYISLGGSRMGRIFTYRNVLITMLLGGLWHGAAWNFVVWGALLGTVLVLERVGRDLGLGKRLSPVLGGFTGSVVRWFAIFHIVCLSWVFFRAESFDDALGMLQQFATAGGGLGLVTPLVVITIGGMVLFQFWPDRLTERLQQRFSGLSLFPQAAALGVGLFMIERLGPEGVAPFIYFQF